MPELGFVTDLTRRADIRGPGGRQRMTNQAPGHYRSASSRSPVLPARAEKRRWLLVSVWSYASAKRCKTERIRARSNCRLMTQSGSHALDLGRPINSSRATPAYWRKGRPVDHSATAVCREILKPIRTERFYWQVLRFSQRQRRDDSADGRRQLETVRGKPKHMNHTVL